MTREIYKGPLEGLTVLDFGWYFAGPMAGMLLADQGATVIHIVKPGERELPSQQYRLLNRNKKLLELDLKSEEGKEQALSLIAKADVLIENFRPGVMKRLGLDYASVKDMNPGLVYLSLPGFASTDTDRAHLQAWEGIVSAAAGVFTSTAISRDVLNYPPVYTSVPLCSAYASVHGVNAVMAALLDRGAHGYGTVIEVPLMDAVLITHTDHFIFGRLSQGSFRTLLDENMPVLDHWLPYLYDSDATEDQNLANLGAFQSKWSHMRYEAGDGRALQVYTNMSAEHSERFYTALGIYDQLRGEGFGNEGPWGQSCTENDLSRPALLTPERRQRRDELVQKAFKGKTAREWEDILIKAGVPASLISTREEWLARPELQDSGVFTRMDDGGSELLVPGTAAHLTNAPVPQYHEAEPVTVEQAVEMLSGVERVKPSGSHPSGKKGDMLKGLKVLDLCSVVAGPSAAYTLAQYGAEVIRVEPPKCFNHPSILPYTTEVNQGKRSIILDIKSEPGRKIFNQLVSWADIAVHNRLGAIAERLGVTPSQLRTINPKITVCQISAFGGPLPGAWNDRQGYDSVVNMTNGLCVNYGSLQYPLYFSGVSSDILTGMFASFTGLLGLYQLRRTGIAADGKASLARSANFTQSPWMIVENGNSDWGEPKGAFAKGPHPWQRLYECADQWIYVGTTEAKSTLLAKLVCSTEIVDEANLEAGFAQHSAKHWSIVLGDADITCHEVLEVNDLCKEELVKRVSCAEADETIIGAPVTLRWDEHPCGIPMMLPAPTWARIGENASYKRLTPAPRVGEHTREILAELGYAPTDIEHLVDIKVAHDYLPALESADKHFPGKAIK